MKFFNSKKSKVILGVTVAGAAAMLAPEVFAGTGGTEFDTIYNTMVGWMTGTLGRLITIGLLLTGIGMGVVQQSVMAAVPAVAAGLILNAAPGVIGGIVSAVI